VTADVVIIDSGGANLASLQFALQRLDTHATISADPARIGAATHVLLPGVGAAQDAMRRLQASGLSQLIPTLVQPVLGICLGMQLLFASSTEAAPGGGATTCLGVVSGQVERLQPCLDLPVPHMGWNQIQITTQDPLLAGVAHDDYFYFVHGFAAPVNAATLAQCEYGCAFAAVVRRDNFRGVQFHPERSARAGAHVLQNFLALKA
jgi:glutamine amidotransferase